MEKEPRYWMGPVRCDFCGNTEPDAFVDGQTKMGPWAIMCLTSQVPHTANCFEHNGKGVNPGVGQKYVKQDDGRYMKGEG